MTSYLFFLSLKFSFSFFFFRPDGGVLALGLWGQDVMCSDHVLVCLYTSHHYVFAPQLSTLSYLTLRLCVSFTYLLFRYRS